jgi:GH24 family phage-related lysozyme (muramidase)
MKWVKAGGKTLKGLVRRREAEANLYFTPII